MPAARKCPPAARHAASRFPLKPKTEIMFGVTPIAASGETMGSVTRVETLCGTSVNDGTCGISRRSKLAVASVSASVPA